jgi:ethanolamine utilization protein EutQ (cupin superfamily)
MSVHHVTIDDTRTWFQASDREVYIGDVLDLATSATTRVRFGRYGKGAAHEWIVTHDETLIVTRGVLKVRSAGGVQVVRAGEVASLGKGTRVVYEGEDDDTEVVFVTYVHWADASRHAARPELVENGRGSRAIARLLPPSSATSAVTLRKGA